MLVVVSAFTSVQEAHLALSVLQAAGIDARGCIRMPSAA
jgi:hypothetical protein